MIPYPNHTSRSIGILANMKLHGEEEGGWVNEGEGEDRSGLDPAFGVYRDRLTVRRKKGVGWALHALTGWMGRCETTYDPTYQTTNIPL